MVGVSSQGGLQNISHPTPGPTLIYRQERLAEVEGAEGLEAWEEQGVSAEVMAETEAWVVAREGMVVHWGRAGGGWWSDSRFLPRRVRAVAG